MKNDDTELVSSVALDPNEPEDLEVLPPGYLGSTREHIFSFCEYNVNSPFLASFLTRSLSMLYQMLSITIILLSTGSFVLQTEPQYYGSIPTWALVIDILSCAFFTVDYFVRLGCAPYPWKFIMNIYNIFDFLSFAPMYVEWVIGTSAASPSSMLRFLRLLRVFRLFRLARYSETLKIAFRALADSLEGFVLLFMVLILNLVFFSTLMYFVEGHYCYLDPEKELWHYKDTNGTSPFQSIASTFWWNIVSITTVGYGDVVPRTTPGRIVAAFALFFGIILLAFPIAVFGTNFHTIYNDWKKEQLHGRHMDKIKGKERQSKLYAAMALMEDVRGIKGKIEELLEQVEEHHMQIADRLALLEQLLGRKDGTT